MVTIFTKAYQAVQGISPKRDLPYILAQAKARTSLGERLDWMEMLMIWMRSPVAANETIASSNHAPVVRLRFLIQLLERHPEWKSQAAEVWASFFAHARGLNLFAYEGILESKGVFDQVTGILVERILPLSKEDDDLTGLLLRIFNCEADEEWVHELSQPLLQEMRLMIESGSPLGPKVWKPLLSDMIEALPILAIQIAAVGTSPSIWSRIGPQSPSTLPFIRLLDAVRVLVDELRIQCTVEALHLPLFDAVFQEIAHSYQALDQVIRHLQETGVNMGLIFRLQQQSLLLQRLQLLTDSLQAIARGESLHGLQSLLCEMIQALSSYRTISSLFHGNMQLLALRVVEHAGNSGEHYITRNRQEYWKALRSAAGGGVLTVGTSCLKVAISHLKAPAFIEALAHWLNFSSSFLLMQACHFTLATKQPSMTASALAKKLSQSKGPDRGLALASEIRLIMRSQVAAAIGNVGMAVPTALLLAYITMKWQGTPLFPVDYASYSVESLHPLKTLTLFFAAMTGGLLWLSSLVAGWVENWVAFQQIPARLRSNRPLKLVFGNTAGAQCAAFLTRNISGIAGNISLGFLLAMLPFLGRILGLPLDVRHVTLSSAQLAIAAFCSYGQVPLSALIWASVGIVCTGLLNFGVSFWLALAVAGRAQRVRRIVKRAVLQQFFHLFRSQPLSFFFPKRDIEE